MIFSEFFNTLNISWVHPTQCHRRDVFINSCSQVLDLIRNQICIHKESCAAAIKIHMANDLLLKVRSSRTPSLCLSLKLGIDSVPKYPNFIWT